MSLVAPTDTGRDIAHAARALFAREDMPLGGVRLFGVRAEGLQARSVGVAVTLDRDERPAASERAMDQVRSKFGAGALEPATLLRKAASGERLEREAGLAGSRGGGGEPSRDLPNGRHVRANGEGEQGRLL